VLSEKILYGTLKPGEIVIGDVDGDPTAEDAKFVFRGETKPSSVPDTPPIDLAKSGE